MSSVKKGDIVTDTNSEHTFYECQGRVTRVYQSGTVMVCFPKECVPEWAWHAFEEHHSITIGYKADEVESLRKDDGWIRAISRL